jgi:hypothetical protein
MADKRISQLVERTDIANNDVVPIVASGATTTNKATISSIQEFMQENLDLGVTSVGITLGTTGTDVSVTGSPITTSGNITINFPTASATNRGLLSSADWTTFNNKQAAGNYVTLDTAQTITAQKTFTTSGSSDTMIISHGSGSGFALDVIKAGNGEAIRVNKTSGSGNAMTVIGGNFEAPTIVKTGGTSSQFLKADGSVDSSTYLTTSIASLTYVTIATPTTITGVKTFSGNTLQLQADGTSQATIFRNSSGQQTNTVGSNSFGFNNSNNIYFNKGSLTNAGILVFNNTAARAYTLPDATGTISLTSDLDAYVTLNTTQTINGFKTFSNTIFATNGATIGDQVLITKSTNSGGLIVNQTGGTGNAVTITGGLLSGVNARFSAGVALTSDGGTNQATTFINTSAIYSGSSGSNILGFNGNNNIYFSKGLANGGVIGWNNSVARSYLLPDADGTIALTSNLGAYLPLTGGTLTGALNGTSASFSNIVTNTSGGFRTSVQQGYVLRNDANNASLGGLTRRSFWEGGTAADTQIFAETGFGIFLNVNGSVTSGLTLASTGAATFSSSVGIGVSPTNRLTALASETGTQITTIPVAKFANTGNAFSKVVIGSDNANFDGVISMDNNATLANTKLRFYIGNGTNPTAGHSNDQIVLQGNGNVGIGTASPDQLLQVSGNISLGRFNVGSSRYVGLTNGGGGFGDSSGSHIEFTSSASTNGINFYTYNGTTYSEKMRITSGGSVWMGTQTDTYSRGARLDVNGDETMVVRGYGSGFGIGIFMVPNSSATGTHTAIAFRSPSNTDVGSITTTSSATLYNTISDYRLKEDLQEVKGLEKVQAINVYDYKWKSDESRMDGVLAHELAEVLPYAVTGEKDAVDEEGNDKMQGVDYSKIVPILIKAIQELKTEIDSLKNQIK